MTLDNGKVTVTSLLPILGTVNGSMTLKELSESKPQQYSTTRDSGSSSGGSSGGDK